MSDTTTETADQDEPITITNEELFLELKKTRRQLVAVAALVSMYVCLGALGFLGLTGIGSVPYADTIVSALITATALGVGLLMLALRANGKDGLARRILPWSVEWTEWEVEEALDRRREEEVS